MNTPTIPTPQKRRLRAHFGFTGMPFHKNVPAHRMFDSRAQRDLAHALRLWASSSTRIRSTREVTKKIGPSDSPLFRRRTRI